MQILARLKKIQPEIEVILLSDPKNISLAMEGMRQGASDEITVPFDVNLFKKKVQSALKRRKARLKVNRNRSLLNIFENTTAVATFAQAGEFETAQKNYKSDGDKKKISAE